MSHAGGSWLARAGELLWAIRLALLVIKTRALGFGGPADLRGPRTSFARICSNLDEMGHDLALTGGSQPVQASSKGKE